MLGTVSRAVSAIAALLSKARREAAHASPRLQALAHGPGGESRLPRGCSIIIIEENENAITWGLHGVGDRAGQWMCQRGGGEGHYNG
jgi:hypothetical protein